MGVWMIRGLDSHLTRKASSNGPQNPLRTVGLRGAGTVVEGGVVIRAP